MNLIVLLKPVIDLSNSRVSRSQSRIIENGPRVMNMSDRNALEMALMIKDKLEVTIHAISMGGEDASSILREAVAVGADRAYHLSDTAFDGGDALSLTYTLGMAIKRIDVFDIILCGNQSEDGIQSQIGIRLAEFLEIQHITSVKEITFIDKKRIEVQQVIDKNSKNTEISLPAAVSVIENANSPRLPNALKIMKAYKTRLTKWNADDIGADINRLGNRGAATQVKRVYIS